MPGEKTKEFYMALSMSSFCPGAPLPAFIACALVDPHLRRPTSTPQTRPAIMATRTRSAKVSLINHRVDTLITNAVETPPRKAGLQNS